MSKLKVGLWFFLSVKKLVELQSFVSAHCLMMLYICTKFCANISKCFKVIERTLFPNRNCIVVVVVSLFYVHGKHLRSCWDDHTFSGQA